MEKEKVVEVDSEREEEEDIRSVLPETGVIIKTSFHVLLPVIESYCLY
jgi:hypothetical protein